MLVDKDCHAVVVHFVPELLRCHVTFIWQFIEVPQGESLDVVYVFTSLILFVNCVFVIFDFDTVVNLPLVRGDWLQSHKVVS